jgi:hypothetical protein
MRAAGDTDQRNAAIVRFMMTEKFAAKPEAAVAVAMFAAFEAARGSERALQTVAEAEVFLRTNPAMKRKFESELAAVTTDANESQAELAKLNVAMARAFSVEAPAPTNRPDPSNDSVWKLVTPANLEHFQFWFVEMVQRANLQRFIMTKQIDEDTAELMSQVANEAIDASGVHPAILLTLAHQFVDADELMRQLHFRDWVAFMMTRPVCAPQPERYAEYLKERFFSADG